MAKVGAQRAAVLTGKSKSTIQRAMNSGKLSYELDQNKRRIIDVSELERVFGIVQTAPKLSPAPKISSENTASKKEDVEGMIEKERMAMQIKMLEQQLSTAEDQIDDLRDQRNKWEKQASQMLITSQYSQRQAEELRTQIREREERARQRRLQNAKTQNSQSSGAVSRPDAKPVSRQVQRPVRTTNGKDLDSQMQKLRAQNENATQDSASVFRFWKKAKG